MTNRTHLYYYIGESYFRSEDLETGKKRGPKTDNPKIFKMGIKLDQKSKDILDAYCQQECVSGAEAIRRGISRLEPDLKK